MPTNSIIGIETSFFGIDHLIVIIVDLTVGRTNMLSKNFQPNFSPLYAEFRSFYLDIHYSCLISVAIVEVGITFPVLD